MSFMANLNQTVLTIRRLKLSWLCVSCSGGLIIMYLEAYSDGIWDADFVIDPPLKGGPPMETKYLQHYAANF
jgi:hypothetical protein